MHEEQDPIFIIGAGATHHTPIRIQLSDGTTKETIVETTTPAALPALNGTIVLTNKSFGNQRLATLLAGKTGRSPVIFLQNGLDVERPPASRWTKPPSASGWSPQVPSAR